MVWAWIRRTNSLEGTSCLNHAVSILTTRCYRVLLSSVKPKQLLWISGASELDIWQITCLWLCDHASVQVTELVKQMKSYAKPINHRASSPASAVSLTAPAKKQATRLFTVWVCGLEHSCIWSLKMLPWVVSYLPLTSVLAPSQTTAVWVLISFLLWSWLQVSFHVSAHSHIATSLVINRSPIITCVMAECLLENLAYMWIKLQHGHL